MNFLTEFEGSPGLLGKLADLAVAREHREINAWVISLLNLQPRDRVLEIGFGPGLALGKVSQLLPDGFIAGITSSEPLLHRVRARNRAAVQAARMDLRLATARALPYTDQSFDKAFSIDSINACLDPTYDLIEIKRVLRKDGLLAVAWDPSHMDCAPGPAYTPEEVIKLFIDAGWSRVVRHELGSRFCVMGVKRISEGHLS